MRTSVKAFGIVGILLSLCPSMFAQNILATGRFSATVGFSSFSRVFKFNFGSAPSFGIWTNLVFENLNLTTNDVGHTFWVSRDTSSNFDMFVSILTDGNADTIGYIVQDGGGWFATTRLESAFFSPVPVDGNGVDFQGFQIDSIVFQLDGLAFTSPGSNPRGDGKWTDLTFACSIYVYGYPPVRQPQLQGPTRSNGETAFEFASTTGQNYTVQYTDSLAAPNWHTLISLTGNGLTKRISDQADAPMRFYRLRLE